MNSDDSPLDSAVFTQDAATDSLTVYTDDETKAATYSLKLKAELSTLLGSFDEINYQVDVAIDCETHIVVTSSALVIADVDYFVGGSTETQDLSGLYSWSPASCAMSLDESSTPAPNFSSMITTVGSML